MLTFRHSGSAGDLIYSLPSLVSLAQGQPVTLYLHADIHDPIPAWAGVRNPLRLSRAQAESLMPLLHSQGIACALFQGQHVDLDLDLFRHLGWDFCKGDLAKLYGYVFPCTPILWEPWLQVEPDTTFADTVLVNRTLRYQNGNISYRFLEGRKNVVFVGFGEEYQAFMRDCRGIPHAQAVDALQLARWIAGAKGFAGNQSFCWSLAEALKVPRVLEVFGPCPNCPPHGPRGFDCINQEMFVARVVEVSVNLGNSPYK